MHDFCAEGIEMSQQEIQQIILDGNEVMTLVTDAAGM